MNRLEKVEENSRLFHPVKTSEDLSLTPNHRKIFQVADDNDDDDEAWMREDAVSLEDDEDEERLETLPFGLNQSWPRVSRPSYRHGISPRVQHPKKKLLRQISQESLDESTSLLLGHIVMLPDTPQDLVLDAGLHMDLALGSGLSKFPEHPLVEEDGEDAHEHLEEEKIVKLLEQLNEQNTISELSYEFSDDQMPDDQVKSAELSGDRLSDGPRLVASSDSAMAVLPKVEKVVLSDLESIERDCFESEDQQAFPLKCVGDKLIGENMTVCGREQRVRDISESPNCDEITSATDAMQSPGNDFELLVEESSEIMNNYAIENKTDNLLNKLTLNSSKTTAIEESNQDLQVSYTENGTVKDVPQENTLITSRDRAKRNKSSPGGKKQRPLLRYLSQESIEESTNLLMDHVVMMDLQRNGKQMSPEGKDERCPFLVDINESPLLDEDVIRGVKNEEEEEEEEMFLYRGDVDSCDEEEEDEEDDDAQLENSRNVLEDDMVEMSEVDYLHLLESVSSKSIISDSTAKALKDIELLRIELNDAINTFQNLGQEFPEHYDGDHLLEADVIPTEVIEEDEDDHDDEVEDCSAFRVLPDELLILIFKYFTHAELCNPIMLVCRKWSILAKDPLLWMHLDLSNKAGISTDILAKVFSRCTLLHGITFRGRDEVSNSEIQTIVDCCPNVACLDFGFVRTMQEDQFSLLISGCRSLTSLNMEGCNGIVDSLISKLILLPRLRSLNLSHCIKLTDGAVFEIARFCDKLEFLDINGVPWITDTAVIMLCNERSETLKSLKLDGIELTDESIRHVIQCPKLEELDVSFCEQLTDHTLTLLQDWKNPKRLCLHKGKDFSEEALANLFISPQMSNLTYLDLSECSELRDPGLTNIANRCPLLTHLAIEWCWFITDVGVVQILDNCGLLKHLDLIGLHVILGHWLSDIPAKLPHLEFLDLTQCNRITDSMLVQTVSMKRNLVIMNYYGEEVVHNNFPGTLDL